MVMKERNYTPETKERNNIPKSFIEIQNVDIYTLQNTNSTKVYEKR